MTDILSFETAAKLRDMGYPQPQKKFSQIWYIDHNEKPVIIGSALGWECMKYSSTFCPHPHDILNELGEDFFLSFLNGKYWCIEDSLFGGPSFSNVNAAEACAMAWINKNKK